MSAAESSQLPGYQAQGPKSTNDRKHAYKYTYIVRFWTTNRVTNADGTPALTDVQQKVREFMLRSLQSFLAQALKDGITAYVLDQPRPWHYDEDINLRVDIGTNDKSAWTTFTSKYKAAIHQELSRNTGGFALRRGEEPLDARLGTTSANTAIWRLRSDTRYLNVTDTFKFQSPNPRYVYPAAWKLRNYIVRGDSTEANHMSQFTAVTVSQNGVVKVSSKKGNLDHRKYARVIVEKAKKWDFSTLEHMDERGIVTSRRKGVEWTISEQVDASGGKIILFTHKEGSSQPGTRDPSPARLPTYSE